MHYYEDYKRVHPVHPLDVLGGGRGSAVDRLSAAYDLVEQVYYLYVRVVKAKDLSLHPLTGRCDPYVEVRLGNYHGTTRHFDKRNNPEWNHVFAFSKDHIHSSSLEVVIRDRQVASAPAPAAARIDDHIGKVLFDLRDVPTRVPSDSPLAPQWYHLEDWKSGSNGVKNKGEIMLAVWISTQADDAFPEAWHSDAMASGVYGDDVYSLRSKVYVAPKLWYLRVAVIEAKDVQPEDKNRVPDVYVKATVGNQVLKTSKSANHVWNEDLIFVVAEPFEEDLVVTIEDHVGPSRADIMGRTALPIYSFVKRLDHRPVDSRWFNMEKFGFGVLEADRRKELIFASRLHLRACLEGAYHVMDEPTTYISDTRPTAWQLWRRPVGLLEIGILGAHGLPHMKVKEGGKVGTTDAYCVAKYGQKWVRTRTIVDSVAPRWNEQYTWEVHDPCTVLTLALFDNGHVGGGKRGANSKDAGIGKLRIRLSTLETDRVYSHSYPLMVLESSGVKKMGELQLAVRFSCLSLAAMLYLYAHPQLPKMHYIHPFTVTQLDNLRYQATNVVAARLARAEPPLKKEVVEHMLDVESTMWSMRKSKAHFFRVVSLLSGAVAVLSWLDGVCQWTNPVATLLVHLLLLILISHPDLILPTAFLYLFLLGLLNYRLRPLHPSHMDLKLSWAELATRDELDEEFDTYPTSRPPTVVHMRYDRLRSVAGRLQTVAGDVATQGERLQALLSWRDVRATAIFVALCVCTAVVIYVTPFQMLAALASMYWLRHPRLRSRLPSAPVSFFKRLPSRVDSVL